jgi:hypothetical protein
MLYLKKLSEILQLLGWRYENAHWYSLVCDGQGIYISICGLLKGGFL